ncbi:MAG: DUF5320 domain-containing protein [Methanothrix sp.]|nr:DUF5320 domain-containing protein [Methanothrix sp.]NLX38144.1 DUF5320 domain-containing protein [Methanothrix sp.]HNR57596.1 DUF5320 domain-containing protein [Methanothrix sp.]HNT72511.1 DUF5320 domain-containing protein [Methanothrix sp.]HOI68721.1 DUF5320 domain-containing protein [Methanothrix sp.]
MPGGDGTGPSGFGPRTGRGMGYCSGFDAPGCLRAGYGRSFGAGRGGGPGRGGGRGRCIRLWSRWTAPIGAFGPYPASAPSPEVEMADLEGMAESLEAQLKSIKARMEELKSQK